MKAVIYARVSTADQNCASQLKEVREYLVRMGWENAGEFVDTGFSGSKASRPALDQLMKDASLRKFDCVVVYKLDRFGRSVLHLNQQLAILESLSIRFVAISQGIDTDAKNPTSRLLLHILSSVAEFERELIKERTLCGIKSAKAKGKTLGRPKRIFQRDEVVRLRDEGMSWRKISEKLGVPTMTVLASYRSGSKCTEIVPETEAAR